MRGRHSDVMPRGGPQEGEEGGLKMLALEGVGYLACTLEQWNRVGGRGGGAVRRWDDAFVWCGGGGVQWACIRVQGCSRCVIRTTCQNAFVPLLTPHRERERGGGERKRAVSDV